MEKPNSNLNDRNEQTPSNDLVRPGLCHGNKKIIHLIKENLRNKIQVPTLQELRRSREPYYTSKYKDLVEDGYPKAASFLLKLVEIEEIIHKQKSEGFKMKRMFNDQKAMDNLFDLLKKVEQPNTNAKLLKQFVLELLTIGREYASGVFDFKWIAESVLLNVLSISRNLLNDKNETLAKALFYTGKLYVELRNYSMANQYLEEALTLSSGQEWILSKTENFKIFHIASEEYCESLLKLADISCYTKSKLAKYLCEQALGVAKKINDITVIGKVYGDFGKLLTKLNETKNALAMYENYLSYAHSAGDNYLRCSAEIETSECFYILKQYSKCLKHAKRGNQLATINNFKNFLAQSYWLMAHAERSINLYEIATEHYIIAIDQFFELGEFERSTISRCFAAITGAQCLIPVMEKIILKMEKGQAGDNEFLQQILDWKVSRIPFYDLIDDSENLNQWTKGTIFETKSLSGSIDEISNKTILDDQNKKSVTKASIFQHHTEININKTDYLMDRVRKSRISISNGIFNRLSKQ